jgi:hypothetical protein
MKHILLATFCIIQLFSYAQIDSLLLKKQQIDSIKPMLNMDAIYARPFINISKTPVSIGGYTEVNWQYLMTDGITDGHQFQARRTTLFFASTISKRIKFLTEIEFEDGANEIALEFASIDIAFNNLLYLRGGIILNPIGSFNQNHDGPKWEFIDRPLASTQMLPATFSNSGFGIFGKKYLKNWMFGYEFYLSGNFDNSIIDNPFNKTYLVQAKKNKDRFEEINSGRPLTTGKICMRNSKFGEFGISYMGGIYNKFQEEGIKIDTKRRLDIFAIDYNHTFPTIKTIITGEWAWVSIQVPNTILKNFGNRQYGGFLDIIQPIYSKQLLGWPKAILNIACRIEYVDWNVATFEETNSTIGEDIWCISPALSFRPTQQTVIRLNYKIQKQTDFLNNPSINTRGFQFGFSSYF